MQDFLLKLWTNRKAYYAAGALGLYALLDVSNGDYTHALAKVGAAATILGLKFWPGASAPAAPESPTP